MARGPKDNAAEPSDWVTRTADLALRHAEQVNGGTLPDLVTCASGISPSGPIHLGNLREFLTVHFVAEEIRRRGINVRHLHSWDDYDRFRKVPAGVDTAWNEHIGRPLSAVPDPGGEFSSWAERFKAPLRAALAEMGCEMVEVSQTQMYQAGTYREQVLTAIRKRGEIETVMARFRTKKASDPVEAGESTAEEDTEHGAGGRADLAPLFKFPYKPYCRGCGRDTVTLTSYDDDTTDLAYTCDVCGESHVTNVATQDEGKLVWKVDWPMRWTFEGVHFEPGGVDHATPGSSYTVGKEIVGPIFGGTAPSFVGYSFVGVAGMPKMSSSKGGVPTAAEALRILEAPILRWLYVRRQPKQAFNVDFGQEVLRLYDEWDALTKKAADPAKRDAAVLAWERASATAAAGRLPVPKAVVPFRMLSSVADVTAGSREITARTVAPGAAEADLEPRLTKAATWIVDYVDPEDRTTVRSSPDAERLAALDEDEERWLRHLLDRLPESFADADELTALIYGVPKLARGLALDDAPTDEVKADQKAFFKLLYNLLVAADRGPRLPTLFAALGPERVRSLLTP